MIRCLLAWSSLALVAACGDDGAEQNSDAAVAVADGAAEDAAAPVSDANADAAVDATPAPCFVGEVTKNDPPTSAGPGLTSVWSYQGQLGIIAGDNLCKAIGADHVCTYTEVLEADQRGELAQTFGETDTFWLHRVSSITVDSTVIAAGAGGRCNDWTYPGNQLADGEFGEMGSGGVVGYNFDSNACYTTNAGDGCAEAGIPCGGVLRAIPCCTDACGL